MLIPSTEKETPCDLLGAK